MNDQQKQTGLRVAVTGASSQVGEFLLPRLADGGSQVIALSRKPREDTDNVEWLAADLDAPLAESTFRADALIHLAPLWLLPDRIAEFAARGVTRIVALGSTSVFAKAGSADAGEHAVVTLLAQAESALTLLCERRGVAWTLLRPTMIYGAGRDANVRAIAAFIRRFGFFPVAGEARGLRAPVHADDVAQACAAALDGGAARNRAYQLCGGETLTYRDMVLRVFATLGRPPLVVTLPERLMLLLASAASMFGVQGINAELVRRMNRDQTFDCADAARDLDFAPRRFTG